MQAGEGGPRGGVGGGTLEIAVMAPTHYCDGACKAAACPTRLSLHSRQSL